MRRAGSAISAVALTLLAACASGAPVWDYAGSGPINATTKTKANDKRLLLSREANIAVHYEVARCSFEYAGTVVIEEAPQAFALQRGQRVMVQFNFLERDHFFRGGGHDAFNQVLTVSPGATYEFNLIYGRDGIDYDVVEKRGGSRRQAQMVPLQNCT